MIFIGNAGNDQSLGQLLWTGVVPNETFRGSGKGGVSLMSIASGPDAGARGSRTLAVIVQSKVRAVTDGGPNRFTVADAPEIVRRSMALANHVGLSLKRSHAVNPSTVHNEIGGGDFLPPASPVLPRKRYGNGPRFPNVITTCILKAFWSGRRDSNPRPQPWQGCALPLSYSRAKTNLEL